MVSSTAYPSSMGLFTDLYQVTMAYGYWRAGVQDHDSVFQLFFRRNPFQGGYAVTAGLATAIDYLQRLRFSEEDQEYLASLFGNDGQPMFSVGFWITWVL